MDYNFVPIQGKDKSKHCTVDSSHNFKTGKWSLMSTTAGSLRTEKHVHKISEAHEFEDFRNIPKFTKPHLAVIHPSPVKKKPPASRPELEFELEGSPARLLKKDYSKKEIPDHLMKAPIESTPKRKSSRVKSPKKLKGSDKLKSKLEIKK